MIIFRQKGNIIKSERKHRKNVFAFLLIEKKVRREGETDRKLIINN